MTPARYNHTQQTGFIAAEFSFDTQGLGSGLEIGAMPRGSRIVDAYAVIDTAFSAGATISLGTNPNTAADDYVTSATIAPATAGQKDLAAALRVKAPPAADMSLYLKLGGTAATAGKGFIYIAYVPNNDVGGTYPA